MNGANPLVGILTGSPNDLPTVVKVRDTLTELGIPSEIIVAPVSTRKRTETPLTVPVV